MVVLSQERWQASAARINLLKIMKLRSSSLRGLQGRTLGDHRPVAPTPASRSKPSCRPGVARAAPEKQVGKELGMSKLWGLS